MLLLLSFTPKRRINMPEEIEGNLRPYQFPPVLAKHQQSSQLIRVPLTAPAFLAASEQRHRKEFVPFVRTAIVVPSKNVQTHPLPRMPLREPPHARQHEVGRSVHLLIAAALAFAL